MIVRTEKWCPHCKTTRPVDVFGPNASQADGLCSWCRECRREYRRTPSRQKVNLEKQRRRARNKPETMTEMRREYRYKMRRDPRHLARCRLGMAVRRGIVDKPECCSRCDTRANGRGLHGHHHDYSKPLEVEWLCRPCHDITHDGCSINREVRDRLKGDDT